MTLSVSFRGAADGEDGPFDLCSVSAWSALSKWASALPEQFVVLRELVKDGSAGPTDRLAEEMIQALEESPPKNGVMLTAQALADRMGVGAPDEVVIITDEDMGPEQASYADPTTDSGKDIALTGPDGKKVESLLSQAQRQGTATLARLTAQAARRLLAKGPAGAQGAKRLFSAAELDELAATLAATNATAELLGRARIAARAEAVKEHAEFSEGQHDFCMDGGPNHGKPGRCPDPSQSYSEEATAFKFADPVLAPMPPQQALDYFLSLYPSLDVDPARFGPLMERASFTLAAATDEQILTRVQETIATLLKTGQDVRGTQEEIDYILDQAGVSPANPQYAEMVTRTNVMDSYNTGGFRELAASAETFPVYRYSNPVDSRSRPHHAARNGKYYSSKVPFVEVRGTGIEDAANDRCTFMPVDKFEWQKLVEQGAKVEEGPPW